MVSKLKVNTSRGQPVYKIWSLYLRRNVFCIFSYTVSRCSVARLDNPQLNKHDNKLHNNYTVGFIFNGVDVYKPACVCLKHCYALTYVGKENCGFAGANENAGMENAGVI